MSIRIACPRCAAVLVVKDHAAGQVANCPKCRGSMMIPEKPVAVPPPPVYDDVPIIEDEPAPTPAVARAKSRPQVNVADNRPRPRKKPKPQPRRKKGMSAGVLVGMILGIGAVLAIVSVGGWLAYQAMSSKPVAKAGTLTDDPKTGGSDAEPEAPRRGSVSYGPLPAGWSWNSPTLGFKACWPTDPGTDNFTPSHALVVGYSGTKPNGWSFVQQDERNLLMVAKIDLLDDGTLDENSVLNNYIDKAKRRAPVTIDISTITIDGKPAREFTYETENAERVIHRATVVGSTLWTIQATFPSKKAGSAEIARRFLDSFRAF